MRRFLSILQEYDFWHYLKLSVGAALFSTTSGRNFLRTALSSVFILAGIAAICGQALG